MSEPPPAYPEQAPERGPDPVVMYLVVRTSLKMGVGKIAAQCGHAVMLWKEEHDHASANSQTPVMYHRILLAREWRRTDYTKIVLGASDEEFRSVRMENAGDVVLVRDRGYTEISADSETVLALWPMLKSKASATLKALKPLR